MIEIVHIRMGIMGGFVDFVERVDVLRQGRGLGRGDLNKVAEQRILDQIGNQHLMNEISIEEIHF